MAFLKILCAIGVLVVLVSNIWSISGWIEARGVYDDHYLKNKLKEIDFPQWNDVKRAPCHTWIPGGDKYVLQYPPGTGFILSLFPAGFRVVPLYILTSVVAVGF